jgi:dipeptidyl aminopeptidase/acylaminoacyl peptidase
MGGANLRAARDSVKAVYDCAMRSLALSLVFLLLVPFASAAETSADDRLLDRLMAVKQFSAVAISPDGKRVAWALHDGAITMLDLATNKRRVLTGGVEQTTPQFSPDSRSLAYIQEEKSGQRQLYVTRGAAEPKKLTTVLGFIDTPRWSPDGKQIAFRYIEEARREAGALAAMSRAIGVIEERIDEARIAVIDVATGKLRVVTPADMFVYEFAWSPDSRRIAATATPGSGENNYWIAKLHVVDVAAATMTALYTPKWQVANPIWSPDGSQIAFIEGLMSDQGSTGGDVMLIDANGGVARNVTEGSTFTTTSLIAWTSDGVTIGANMTGNAALARVDTASGRVDTLWKGEEFISDYDVIGAAMARDGRTTAVMRSSWRTPPEVWAGTTGAWKQLTHVNSIAPQWGEVKSLTWTSDGREVQGWLILPRNYSAARKYALVTIVHGGPSSAANSTWPGERNAFIASQDWLTFLPNPRGSYGRGEAFTQANIKDFGHGDLRDILSGIDQIEKNFPVDDTRLGMYGWSYGGFMSMWTVTQTNRFRAAVAGAGIVNWQSYYGQNSIDQWMLPFFGASVYDDPAVYAKSSPINFIRNVETPTLVLVGERDGEVPAPQSFEFWHALKALGVETQLVVYPDEGHRFKTAEHKRDVAKRIVEWLAVRLR